VDDWAESALTAAIGSTVELHADAPALMSSMVDALLGVQLSQ
jgi:hypothetical protein